MIGKFNNHFTTADGRQFDFNRHDKKSVVDAQKKAEAHDAKGRAAASRRAGREITQQEWNLQQIKPAVDSRSYHETVKDSSWKPKLRDNPSQLERMLANAQADAEKKRDPYAGMSAEEARVHFLQNKMDKEAKEKVAVETNASHLKLVAPKLDLINELIEVEKWSTNSDEAFRVLLDQTKRTLEQPNADSVELERLMQAVDDVLIERQANRKVELDQQREELESQLARNSQELELLSDPVAEPIAEPMPNPHAYHDPSKPREYDIDRSQPLSGQIIDLVVAMCDDRHEDYNAVYDADQALRNGDESAAIAMLDKHAKDAQPTQDSQATSE